MNRSTITWTVSAAVLLLFCTVPSPGATLTTTLQPETLRAFSQYTERVEGQLQERVDGKRPFLWVEESPKRLRQLRRGDILTRRFGAKAKIPGGLVHDWLGAAFLPGVKLDQVVSVLRDFNHHAQIYPEVIAAKLLSSHGNVSRSWVKVVKRKVLTVTLSMIYENHYEKISNHRLFIRSYTPRIVEVEDAGTPGEHELPPGHGSGFLWRMNAYWSLEQTSDGVLVELRTISLTRDIPMGLGWMIKPFLTSIPRESLVSTLQATRLAVEKSESPAVPAEADQRTPARSDRRAPVRP